MNTRGRSGSGTNARFHDIGALGQPSAADTLAGVTEWEEPTFADVLEARRWIAPYLRPTPLFAYPMLDELLGTEVFVKHENHQPVGAFKVRGGVNLVAQLGRANVSGASSARRPGTTVSRSRTRPGCSVCTRRSARPRARTRSRSPRCAGSAPR